MPHSGPSSFVDIPDPMGGGQPGKLYGREEERKRILEAFNDIQSRGKCLVSVGGASGVGKSALVDEALEAMASKGAMVLSGKFEQLQRGAAYAAWQQALEKCATLILKKPEDDQEHLKSKLLEAVGANGRILTDMSPKWEELLGEQPPMEMLDGENTRHRYLITMEQVMEVLGNPVEPLVLFLDDWQWADRGSTTLLKALYQNPALEHVLFICAYRNNEVGEGHHFLEALYTLERENWRLKNARVMHVGLGTLAKADLEAMLTDMFGAETEFLKPLTARLYARTMGNVFFTRQLLHTLFEQRIVRPKRKTGGWGLDMEVLDNLSMPDSVVGLTLSRLEQLPTNTRNTLRMAACIGHRFSAGLLTDVLQLDTEEVVLQLAQCLQAGLIVPIGRQGLRRATYAFVHDRVQQACYEQVPLEERPALHLKLAEAWNRLHAHDMSTQALYDITSAFNAARSLTTAPEQRFRSARMNLRSATEARKAAAYDEALAFAREGLGFLKEEDWRRQYELTRELHMAALENAFLVGGVPEMEGWFTLTLKNAQTTLHKVLALELRMEDHKSRQEYDEAFDLGVRITQMVGYPLKAPTLPRILYCLIHIQWRYKRIGMDRVLDLPISYNEEHIIVERCLMGLSVVCYFTRPNYLPHLVYRLSQLMIRNGHTVQSPYSYIGLGVVMTSALRNVDFGYRLGSIGAELRELVPKVELEGRIKLMHNHFVRHWAEPMKKLAPILASVYERCVQHGDFEFATYSMLGCSRMEFMCGTPMGQLKERCQRWQSELRNKLRLEGRYSEYMMYHLAIAWLHGYEDQLTLWNGEPFNEEAIETEMWDKGNLFGLSALYGSRMMGHILLGNTQEAWSYVQSFDKSVGSIVTAVDYKLYYYGRALTLAMRAENEKLSGSERNFFRKALRKIKMWAGKCPENLHHQALLLEAEQLRMRGQRNAAKKKYLDAVAAAEAQEVLHEAALSLDRLAGLLQAQGQHQEARQHLEKALHLYEQWQSPILVAYMEKRLAQP